MRAERDRTLIVLIFIAVFSLQSAEKVKESKGGEKFT